MKKTWGWLYSLPYTFWMCEPICTVNWYFIRVFKIYNEYFFKIILRPNKCTFFLNSRWVNAIHDRKKCEYCQCVIIKSQFCAEKKNSFHSKQKQNNRNSTNGTCPFKKNDTYTVIRFKFMQNNMQTNRIDARSGLCSIVLRIFM